MEPTFRWRIVPSRLPRIDYLAGPPVAQVTYKVDGEMHLDDVYIAQKVDNAIGWLEAEVAEAHRLYDR